jgi:hypothetical protein
MRRTTTTIALGACALLGVTGVATASHQGDAGGPREFAVGSGKNTFPGGGPAHLMVSAHGGPQAVTGHVRAMGDGDGAGPLEAFKLEGEVTCLRVEGNRASVKYRFKHATGFLAPFEGGGVQIFLENNGEPGSAGQPDATAFDLPQPRGVFQLTERDCDDPRLRVYDPIDSGNFTVHDAP